MQTILLQLERWAIVLKLNKLSLKWKLFFFILLFAFLVIMVFSVFQILLLEKVYKTTKIKQTKLIMSEVYEAVNGQKIDNVKNPKSNLTNQIKDIIKDAESVVYILKKEQVTSIDPSVPPQVEYISLYPDENIDSFYADILSKEQLSKTYNSILEVGNPCFVVLTDDDSPYFQQQISENSKIIQDRDLIYCQRVRLSDNSSSYMIVIFARITPVKPAIDTLKTQLLYITLIVIILSIIIAMILSKRISKPITDINKEAKKFSNGEYDLSFKGTGYLEIVELNDTLNYAARELKKTDTLKKELLANVSHDLRTPLTLIEGYAEMMRDFPEEKNKENVQIIIDEVHRLKELVSDLLILSKLNARSEPLNISLFCLTDVVKTIVERQQKFMEHQSFIIKFNYTSKVMIEADKHKIEQVIYNFLNNAIKYSGDSKEVDIIQEIEGDNVVIKIKDYGIGIKEDELPYVWERYYRVDKGHKRSTQGSGLGLAIIKSILDYHNFSYGVLSTYNKGSTFWFKMPIKK